MRKIIYLVDRPVIGHGVKNKLEQGVKLCDAGPL